MHNFDYLAYSHHYIFIHDLFLSLSENLNFSNRLCSNFVIHIITLRAERRGSGWEWQGDELENMCRSRIEISFKHFIVICFPILYINKCPNRLFSPFSYGPLCRFRKYANECHYLVPRYLTDIPACICYISVEIIFVKFPWLSHVCVCAYYAY